MADENYAVIREHLGELIGAKIIDITQHDEEEYKEEHLAVIYVHLDNGKTLYFQWSGEASDDVSFGTFE